MGPRKRVTWDAHWRHLANTIDPLMCGGDAVFLSNYFDHLLFLLLADFFGFVYTYRLTIPVFVQEFPKWRTLEVYTADEIFHSMQLDYSSKPF